MNLETILGLLDQYKSSNSEQDYRRLLDQLKYKANQLLYQLRVDKCSKERRFLPADFKEKAVDDVNDYLEEWWDGDCECGPEHVGVDITSDDALIKDLLDVAEGDESNETYQKAIAYRAEYEMLRGELK